MGKRRGEDAGGGGRDRLDPYVEGREGYFDAYRYPSCGNRTTAVVRRCPFIEAGVKGSRFRHYIPGGHSG